MSVRTDIPEVKALMLEIEKSAGFKMETHTDFINLVSAIEKRLNIHISESTLERLWQYSTRQQENISLFTLNTLVSFAGHTNWETFCQTLKKRQDKESELFNGSKIISENLPIGQKLQIGWMPNRLCTLEYIGKNTFKVLDSQNTAVKNGDTFKALELQLNRPLYLQEFQSSSQTYAVGQEHGLTTLKLL